MSRVTELVEFKTVAGVDEKQFTEIVHRLEVDFHSQQKGFIDTELIRGREEGQWFMIQHWETMEDTKAVVKLMMQSDITENFRRALDPTSVKMQLSEQVGYWEKEAK